MSGKEITRTIEINSTPDTCYRKICDFESYPKWQSAVKEITILKKDKGGKPKVVECRISVLGKDVRYVLEYAYEDKRYTLSWSYVEGDVKDIRGSYLFEKVDKNRTRATFTAFVDPGFWVPGPIINTLNNVAMKKSMEELKDAVEGKK
ncbi:MAG: SRPBCC family protein [Deltaproteobacteria bacterium]|nr:SRPBCC family protein [Deltaproteobacteria bacterium]